MGLDNPLHIAVLLLIILLVFGAKRLPELGRSLGGGMREFKQSVTGESQQVTLAPASNLEADPGARQTAQALAREPELPHAS